MTFPIWAVMADLDLFKKVNDTYGHDAGDTALKSFSEILKANTRQSDKCARLGGEEFLVIITHSDKEGVKTVVERIRKQFENTRVIVGTAHCGDRQVRNRRISRNQGVQALVRRLMSAPRRLRIRSSRTPPEA